MMRKFVAGLTLLSVVVLGACGGDDDDGGGDRDGIVAFLISEGESQEAAECFADELSAFSLDDFEALAEAEGPDDVEPGFLTAVESAAEGACADL